MATGWTWCCALAAVATACAPAPAPAPARAPPSPAPSTAPRVAASKTTPAPAVTAPAHAGDASWTSDADVADLESLQAAACACAGTACADKRLAELRALVKRVEHKHVSSGEHRERIMNATKNLTVCLMQRGVDVADIQAAAGGPPEASGAAIPGASSRPVTSEAEVDRLESIKTAACACTDKACADKVLERFRAIAQQIKDKGLASDDQRRRITGASKDVTICLVKRGEDIADIKAAVQ